MNRWEMNGIEGRWWGEDGWMIVFRFCYDWLEIREEHGEVLERLADRQGGLDRRGWMEGDRNRMTIGRWRGEERNGLGESLDGIDGLV
jgi:hypothetical protein